MSHQTHDDTPVETVDGPALPTASEPRGMSRAMALLFAVGGGAAVGNLYWAQPLLGDIADQLDVSEGAAGLLVTVTQIGYMLGVFLVVPLGDTLNRRRLIPMIMAGSALTLAACSLVPNYASLLVALALLGVTTVAGQLLTPLAGDLARDDQRGRVIGTIAAGMMTGILLSRIVSGLIAEAFGWQAVYGVAAVFMAVLAVLVARSLPEIPPRTSSGYLDLLRSIFSAVRLHRAIPVTQVIGALNMAVFTLFWTALTFLLTDAPYHYSVSQIGLVGLVGLAGAVAAQGAGRLHDRGLSVPATGLALAAAAVALVIAGLGASSIFAVLAAVLLLDVAIQVVNVLNQTRLLSLDATARSRINTVFVTTMFAGAASGSALASGLWALGGWTAVMTGGVAALGVALLTWTVGRRALAR